MSYRFASTRKGYRSAGRFLPAVRALAVANADEGRGAQQLTIAQQLPGAKLLQGVTPANSYVFDVVCVAGGTQHSYCFYGPLNDEFIWNVLDAKPVSDAESSAGEYLRMFKGFPEMKLSGTAPATLEATWQ
jgi:hypothetical protein